MEYTDNVKKIISKYRSNKATQEKAWAIYKQQ